MPSWFVRRYDIFHIENYMKRFGDYAGKTDIVGSDTSEGRGWPRCLKRALWRVCVQQNGLSRLRHFLLPGRACALSSQPSPWLAGAILRIYSECSPCSPLYRLRAVKTSAPFMGASSKLMRARLHPSGALVVFMLLKRVREEREGEFNRWDWFELKIVWRIKRWVFALRRKGQIWKLRS